MTMHLEPTTLKTLTMILIFLAAIAVWIAALLLLVEVTHQLLDVLAYIMKLAQMG
jgi:hypothetical protein